MCLGPIIKTQLLPPLPTRWEAIPISDDGAAEGAGGEEDGGEEGEGSASATSATDAMQERINVLTDQVTHLVGAVNRLHRGARKISIKEPQTRVPRSQRIHLLVLALHLLNQQAHLLAS